MPSIPYARGAHQRADLPNLRCVNQYVETAPSEPDRIVLFGRPGIVRHLVLGTGKIRGMLSQPGAFGGDVFSVMGPTLFRGGASIGAIAGSGLVDMAASPTQILIATGGDLAVSDGAGVTFESMDLVDLTFVLPVKM
jgi:hypothetical protein